MATKRYSALSSGVSTAPADEPEVRLTDKQQAILAAYHRTGNTGMHTRKTSVGVGDVTPTGTQAWWGTVPEGTSLPAQQIRDTMKSTAQIRQEQAAQLQAAYRAEASKRMDTYATNETRIAELRNQLEALEEQNRKNGPALSKVYSAMLSELPIADAESKRAYEKLKAELEALEAANRLYRYGTKAADELYVANAANADFYEVSQNRGLYPATTPQMVDEHLQATQSRAPGVPVQALEVSDPLGTYMSATESAYADKLRGLGVFTHLEDYSAILAKGKEGKWELLSPEEQNLYYYLLNTGRKEQAVQFLDSIKTELARRANEEQYEEMKDASGGELFLHNLASVPANVIGAVPAFVDDALHLAEGEDINPYSGWHSWRNYAQNVRGASAQKLDEGTDGFEVLGLSLGDVYQAGMSGADSLVGYALFNKGYSVIAGMGAASDKAKELYERGASREQIALGSLTSGAAEMLFEKVSLDRFANLRTATNLKDVLYNGLIQGGVEMSEEAATELANILSDCMVMGSQSEWEQLLTQYKQEGYTDGKAISLAVGDMAARVWQAGASGFISGGAMGGGGSAVSYTQNRMAYESVAQTYLTKGGNVESGLETVLQITAPGTDIHTLAQSMADSLQKGKMPSNAAFGRVLAESLSAENTAARQRYDGVMASAEQTGVSAEVAEPVARVAARLGREVSFTSPEVLRGPHLTQTPAGQHTADGRVLLSSSLTTEQAVDYILKHELTHSIEGTEGWNAIQRTVRRSMGEAAWAQAVEQMRQERQGVNDPEGIAHPEREVVAHWIGENLYTGGFARALSENKKTASAAVRILDRIRLALGGSGKSLKASQLAALERTFLQALESGETGNGIADAQEEKAQWSISPRLSTDIDSVLAGRFDAGRNEVYVGETSNFLVSEIGAEAISQYMPAAKIYSAIVTYDEYQKKPYYAKQENYHGLGKDTFMEILKRSESPVAAFASRADDKGNKRQNRIVLVTDKLVNDVETGKAAYAVAVVEVDTRALVSGKRVKANKSITVYPRAKLFADLQEALADGRLLAITKQGERILAGVRGSNPQAAIQESVLKNNIANFWANVKWQNNGAKKKSSSPATPTAMQIAFQKAGYTDQSGQKQYTPGKQKNSQNAFLPEGAFGSGVPSGSEAEVGQLREVIGRLNAGETVSLEEIERNPYIRRIVEIVDSTPSTHTIHTPQRQALRQKVAAQLSALGSYTGVDSDGKEVYNGAVEQGRIVDLVVGLSAAGKSSVLVNPLSQEHRARVIDSDMAKEALPEFNGGLGANAVHQESRDIIDHVLEEALANGDNIVHPIVGGGKTDKLVQTIERFKANGYTVFLHLNEVPGRVSLARALNRFLETGRYIPPSVILGYGDTPTQNFHAIKNRRDLIDGYTHYSNDVPRGQRPVEIETSAGYRELNGRLSGLGSHRATSGRASSAGAGRDGQVNTGANEGSSSVQNGTGAGFSVGQNAFLPEGAFGSGVQEGGVIDLSDDSELSQQVAGIYGAEKYKVIQQYILDALGDQPLRMSDGKVVVVDRSDALHIANRAANKKTAQIAKIKDLVERAELYAEETNIQHNKFDYFCYYRAVVRLGNETFPVYLNVGRGKADGQYHLYDIRDKMRDTADRINGLERPKPNEGYAQKSGVSTDSIPNPGENVKKNSGNGQNAFLPESAFRSGLQEGAGETDYPSVTAGGDTSPDKGRQGGTRRNGNRTVAQGQTLEELAQELGDRELDRRMYMAMQTEKLPTRVTLDGIEMDTAAYLDAVEERLPDSREALETYIAEAERRLQAEAQAAFAAGNVDGIAGLPVNLQLFAARRKLAMMLDAGEEGSEERRFYWQRTRGLDANKAHEAELLEYLAGRSETYNPISNQETLDKAKESLQRPGYAEGLVKRLGRYNPRDRFTETEMAAAMVLINNARNDGDLELYTDLVRGLSRKGTDAGRAVQILSMQAKLTPEGTIRAAQRTLRQETDRVHGKGTSEAVDELAGTVVDAVEQTVTPPKEGTEKPRKKRTVSPEQAQEILERVIKAKIENAPQLRKWLTRKDIQVTLAQRIAKLVDEGALNDASMERTFREVLELPTLTPEDVGTLTGLVNAMQNAEEGTPQHQEAMEAIYRFLGSKLPVTFMERWQSWRKFAMLANPKTHLRNIFSNVAMFGGVEKLDTAIATGLQRLFVDKQYQTAALGWRGTEHGKSILPAVEKATERAVVRKREGGGKYDIAATKLGRYKHYFQQDWLNKASDFNSKALEDEDIFFFRRSYANALGQILVARGLTEVTPEIDQIAYDRAVATVFQADNAINDVLTGLKRWANSDKAGRRLFGYAVDVVIPFSKTPANIVGQTLLHSPVGVIKGAWDIAQACRKGDGQAAADAINTLSKGMTGTALLAVGLLLGFAGLFNTGFGKTEKERAADELAGVQENAFIFGNWSITLDWLQPAASPLIVGASIAQRLREDGFSIGEIFGAMMDGTDSLFEMSMLQSLYDILGGYDAGATATLGSVAENLISQSIPTLVGQAARAIDPVQRKTRGDNDFETVLNRVLAKLPGLTYLLEPELDVWGDEVYRTGKAGTGAAALNAFQQFLSPSNVKVGTGDDAYSREILRLFEEQGAAAIPAAISRDEAIEHGLDHTGTNRTLGKVNRTAVEELFDDMVAYALQEELPNGKKKTVSKRYSEMTDEERRRVLGRIYKSAKAQYTDEEADNAYFEDLIRRLG